MRHIIPFLLMAADEVGSGEGQSAPAADPVEHLGIKNTLEVVEFAIAFEQAITRAKADGKVDLKDLGELFPIVPLVGPMVDGIGQVPKELGDLDDDELAQLIAEATKLLGGEQNAKVVVKVKAAILFAHAGYNLYAAFKK